ncbi:RNA polymerase factor sigma-54 [Rhizobium sp. C1]|uniref:RNA polymerase factor sigma-54 n=1 Tax=Rhizobium sp. C1 TaxID=1349799 RepID=UPI001E3195B4|nr:RNA polymerase factor sigma-54 [Rhizobium sp. C1]MCD2179852.1 RNA polymerase factor sigma-54 [Rhizobium sp. C1]
MAMSASLHLKQSQSLVMTPQLMQSIQLLQMTHFELTQFIEQEVQKNPLLEISPSDGAPAPVSDDGPDMSSDAAMAPRSDSDWFETANTGQAERLTKELDANFEPDFDTDQAERRPDSPELVGQWKSMPGGQGDDGNDFDMDDFAAAGLSLREFVNQQIPFAVSGAADRLIAQHLVDLLDDSGYILPELESVAERIGRPVGDVERVLSILQTLEPAGIFARSLSECLAIQLRQKNRLDPAMSAFVSHLELLARRDFQSLKKLCGVDEDDLLDMLAEIRRLDPKPGSAFTRSASETIVPDIVVNPAADGGWNVELNPDTLPRVLVNQSYYAEVSRHAPRDSADQAFLSECMQNANWLTRSLDQRARTILKVASEIVRRQDGFLRRGVDGLKPLNLKTVADAIKMHESTVSRVTSNKFMMTPRGVYELKYFFTVSISSAEGGDGHSAEAVRNRIRAMINEETADTVLSDDDIVDILKAAGIDLARRTVAKYRDAMNIPSSVQRRREKKAMARIAS